MLPRTVNGKAFRFQQLSIEPQAGRTAFLQYLVAQMRFDKRNSQQ
jgi:hypothetical protein